MEQGRLHVDGKECRIASHQLVAKQSIALLPERERIKSRHGRYASIVYEDSQLAVVDKRCGALSVATDHDSSHTVHNQLKDRYRPHPLYVIHRLDQATSGLMIFGRDIAAFQSLKEQLAAHTMERRYLAVVTGIPDPLSGTWRSYLYEDKGYYVHSSDNPHCGGEEAITHYRTIAHHGPYSILELSLATGKKNQIRVHCQRAALPIVGDEKYDGEGGAPRLMLHAYLLTFVHPTTQESMTFTSPVPRCFCQKVPKTLWLKPPITLESTREPPHVRHRR